MGKDKAAHRVREEMEKKIKKIEVAHKKEIERLKKQHAKSVDASQSNDVSALRDLHEKEITESVVTS